MTKSRYIMPQALLRGSWSGPIQQIRPEPQGGMRVSSLLKPKGSLRPTCMVWGMEPKSVTSLHGLAVTNAYLLTWHQIIAHF